MKKFKELEKKQKIMLAVIIALLACGVIGGIVYAAGADEPDKDAKKQIEQQIDDKKLTDKEKAAVEKLERQMDKELAAAKTDKEKKAILEKYAERISEASGGKIKIDTEVKADKEKKDKDSDKKSDKDSNKGNAGNSSSSGSSSSSGNSGSTSGSSGGSSGGSSSSGSSGSSGGGSTEKPKEKVWVVDVPAKYEKEPIWEYGYSGHWIKDGSGNIIFKTMSRAELEEKMIELEESGNVDWTWGTGLPDVIIGYRDVCVQQEQGHWEYR